MLSGVAKVLATLENHGLRSDPADWVVLDAERSRPADLPLELRYLISIRPSRQHDLEDYFRSGHSLGFAHDNDIPENVAQAVSRISDLTQAGLSNFWLERLFRYGHYPVWTEAEEREAKSQGFDLNQDIKSIKEYGRRHNRFALVDAESSPAESGPLETLRGLNEDLGTVAVPKLLLSMRAHHEKRHSGFTLLMVTLALSWTAGALGIYLAWPWPGLALLGVSPSAVICIKQIYKTYVKGHFGRALKHSLSVQLGLLAASLILVSTGLWAGSLALLCLGSVIGPAYHLGFRTYGVLAGLRRLHETNKLPVWQARYGQNLILAERGPAVRLMGLILGVLAIALILGRFIGPADIRAVFLAAWFPVLASWMSLRIDLSVGRFVYRRSLKKLWRQAIVLTESGW